MVGIRGVPIFSSEAQRPGESYIIYRHCVDVYVTCCI